MTNKIPKEIEEKKDKMLGSFELNRIYCMNCLEGLKRIPDNSIDLVITSPPYNVGINYTSWDDKLQINDYFDFCRLWLKEVFRVLKLDGRMALNVPYEINVKERGGRLFFVSEYYEIIKLIGFKFAGIVDLIERQPHRVKLTAWGSWLSPSAPYIYNPKECVLIVYKENWVKGEKGETTLTKENFQELVYGMWNYRAETKGLTEANFSLDIPKKAIHILTYKDDIVLDCFMGSGTTAVACKQLGRKFIGFEISPEYCKIANKRLAQEVLL